MSVQIFASSPSVDMQCSRTRLGSILAVIGAFLVYMSFGIKFTTGNSNPYLIHFMDIVAGETAWFHAVMVSSQALAAPLGSFAATKIGILPVIVLGCALSSGGVFLSSLTVEHSLGAFIATYGICTGVGIGLPYSAFYASVSKVGCGSQLGRCHCHN